MEDLQSLLNKEAQLQNERDDVLKQIKVIRSQINPNPPRCWGDDDCSSMILMSCPWRIDCGSPESLRRREK